MKRIGLLFGLGILLCALALNLVRSGPIVPAPEPRRERPQTPRFIVNPRPEASPPVRDIFRYADEAQAQRETPKPEGSAAPPPTPSPSPAAVRLVGFLRRADGLKAALAFSDQVWVGGVGEQFGGYEILSADEEEGVKLRAPDGQELQLSPPS